MAPKALPFATANSQYVSLPTLTLTGDFTLEWWLNRAGSGATPTNDNTNGNKDCVVGSAGNNPKINVNFYGNQCRLYDGATDQIVASATTVANVWAHHAIVRTGTSFAYYRDGVLDTGSTGAKNSSQAFVVLAIGFGDSAGQYPAFNGMEELRVWNVARSGAQIAANYNRTVDPASANLLAYFNFGESPDTNTTVTDLVAGTYTGTLQGSPTATRVAPTAPLVTAGPWYEDLTSPSHVRSSVATRYARPPEQYQPWLLTPNTATRPFFEDPPDSRQPMKRDRQRPETARTFRDPPNPPWDGKPKTSTRPWFEESRPALPPRPVEGGWTEDGAAPPLVNARASAAPWSAATATPRPVTPRASFDPAWTWGPLTALRSWLFEGPPVQPPEVFPRTPDEPWNGGALSAVFTARPWADLADAKGSRPSAPVRAQETAVLTPLASLARWLSDTVDRRPSAPTAPPVPEPWSRPPLVTSFAAAAWFDLAALVRPAPVPSQGAQEARGATPLTGLRSWVAELADRAQARIPVPVLTELFMRSPVVSSFVAAAWADIFDLPRRPAPPSSRVDEPWSGRPATGLRPWFETTSFPPGPPLVVRAGEPWNLKTAAASASPLSSAPWGDAPAWVRVMPPRALQTDPVVLAQPSTVVPLSAAPWTNQGPPAPAPRPPLAVFDTWMSGPLKLSLPTWVGDAIAQRQATPPRLMDSQVLGGQPLRVFVDVVNPGRPRPTPGPAVPSQMFERRPVAFLRSWGWQTDEFFRNIPLNTPRGRLFDVVSVDFLPGRAIVTIVSRVGNSATKVSFGQRITKIIWKK